MIVFTLMIALSPVRAAYAADGDLDTTFGTGGKVTTNVSPTGKVTPSPPDGRQDRRGRHRSIGGNDAFAVARYNSNGTLDTSFDTIGVVNTDIGAANEAKAVAIQTDGKIVVAGGLVTAR